MLPVEQVTFKPVDTCLNCGMQFDDTDHFCRACGAKKIEERFTPKRVLHEAGERVFNIDNTFLRTFRDLFMKPEAVIGGFLAGLRKRYLNAFSYFTIAITVSGFQVFVMRRFYPNVIKEVSTLDGKGNALSQMIQDSVMEYQPIVMFATIPILALMGWLTFLSLKKHNYTEHFIIQLYTYSHVSMLGALAGILFLVTGLNYVLFGMFAIPIYILYNAYVFKRLYELSLKRLVLKTLLFLAILLVVYFLVSAIIVAIIIVTDFQGFLEMMKQNAQ
ncbi:MULTISPECIES: DUF3667 domain-containing protein [unclassified Leeuwenhoekiella]|uniref:DUF3667 domain-containing protein n=1 Tax=unclassified Leeuwenhoekiella TaxID=2615029 RepID=UPI000C352FA1|nr:MULTISPECIES: DUF3667 domain-containing protein [unclassified Leeuwenhoekiella]MAS71574.1 hypothetical protein [Zunongwangia sp.]MAW96313.1 hypothetical protein [Leeuwenhoekiella sp.]MBA82804.1 hypothetical protein [Leeuwenhoekiella sp.]|tara:strand:- start:690 stop:1511 length:822 start_codon:yes stop_codon:yes gene_type:complete